MITYNGPVSKYHRTNVNAKHIVASTTLRTRKALANRSDLVAVAMPPQMADNNKKTASAIRRPWEADACRAAIAVPEYKGA